MMRYRHLFLIFLLMGLAYSTSSLSAETGNNNCRKPVAEKCLKDIQAFNRRLWRVGFGVLLSYGPSIAAGSSDFEGFSVVATPRQQIRALHGAAYVYAYSGDKQLCEQTLASMRAIFNEHQRLLGNQARGSNLRMAWTRAHLLHATSIAKMDHPLRVSIIIGAEIRNLKDQRLGEITDVVLNPKQQDILYVLASHGGIFGIGERVVAIPWSDIRATQDHEVYVLDVSPNSFDHAPTVNRSNFNVTRNPGWQQALAQYWDKALTK